MPALPRNPSLMTKERLAEELRRNNIPLPRSRSKKDVYVDLYRRYLLDHEDESSSTPKQQQQWGSYRNMSVNTSPKLGFSSDEEEEVAVAVAVRKTQVKNVNNNRSPRKASKKANLSEFEDRLAEVEGLSDADLKKELQIRGVKPGPIVASTRAVYERKLADLLLQPEQQEFEEGEDEEDGFQEERMEEGVSQENEDDYSDSDVDESVPDTLPIKDSRKSQTSTSSYSTRSTSSSYKSQVTRLMDQEASSKARQRSVTPQKKTETASTEKTTKTTVSAQRREEKSKPLVPVWLQILIFLLVAGFLVLVWYSMETGQPDQNLVAGE
ncbi:lamina-associated polypeptide 2, isoforms beta/delta/epsilon/gamma-like [Patiria miniata]|uniref:Uncharacterized protein n=1 Tax=Patiria miniata TaxID=46514 RepID=A0A914ASS9_PATMI|nr:lamina-associated polypeptide 2, isoforms beta/delta/epsilon/gamma-like [Patiria miniata]